MGKKSLKVLFKIAVSIVLFTILYTQVDINELSNNIRLLDFKYFPVIFGLFLLNYLLSSFRWHALILTSEKKPSVFYLTKLYFIGTFFNNFMPTSIGGDVYKIFRLGQKIKSNADAFSATFMERLTGLIALLVIALFGIIALLPTWVNLLPSEYRFSNGTFILFEFLFLFLLVLGAIVGIYALKFLATRIELFEKVLNSFRKYKNNKSLIVWAVITSFGVQIVSILSQYYIFVALGLNISIIYAMVVFPIVFLASMFIPSLNGFGVQDILYIQFFTSVGLSVEAALGASLVYHSLRLLVSLFGGVVYVFTKNN